jgi:hypothetical protein
MRINEGLLELGGGIKDKYRTPSELRWDKEQAKYKGLVKVTKALLKISKKRIIQPAQAYNVIQGLSLAENDEEAERFMRFLMKRGKFSINCCIPRGLEIREVRNIEGDMAYKNVYI